MESMELKVKKCLWIGLILFLLSNIVVIFVFHNNLAVNFVSGGNFNFGLDSTFLLTDINTIFMPGEPMLPKMVLLIRDFFLIISTLLAIVILYLEKNWKNIGYAVILVFVTSIVLFIQLEIASPGLYDFFRKVKATYTLGVITLPWLYYYLVILIPIIFVTIDISLHSGKVKRNNKSVF